MPTSSVTASATATSGTPVVAVPLGPSSVTATATATTADHVLAAALIEGEMPLVVTASMKLQVQIPPVEPPASIAAKTLKRRSITLVSS